MTGDVRRTGGPGTPGVTAVTERSPRVLPPGTKLRQNFALHARSEDRVVLNQEAGNGVAIPVHQSAQGPGERLDDHVVAIGDDALAHGEGPCDVAAAAPRAHVERHRA